MAQAVAVVAVQAADAGAPVVGAADRALGVAVRARVRAVVAPAVDVTALRAAARAVATRGVAQAAPMVVRGAISLRT